MKLGEMPMKTFYFFGDSITLGVNVLEDDTWTCLLNASMKSHGVPIPPSTFYYLGVRKNASKQIAERFLPEFEVRNIAGAANYFVFMFGTVDTMSVNGKINLETSDSLKYAKELLLQAKERGKCIFITPPPVLDEAHNARIANLAQEQVKLCEEINIPCVDVYSALSQNTVYTQDLNDGIHPQEMGNTSIYDIIWQSQALQEWVVECTDTPEVLPENTDKTGEETNHGCE